MIIATALKDVVTEFELGKEFDETIFNEKEIKTVCTLEGNKLVKKQGSEPPSTVSYEFGEKEMIGTYMADDVVCIRKYRVEED